MDPYDPSQVLFRYAKDLALRAGECRREYGQSGDIERLNRATDACIGAVVMAHSSLESWINQARERFGVKGRPAGAWEEKWSESVLLVAQAKGRNAAGRSLPDRARDALGDLNALRNFPVHADKHARERLESRFPSMSVFPDLIRERIADGLLLEVDEACRYGEHVTGEPAPRWHGAWPGWPS